MPTLMENDIVEFANYYYYSKPMSVTNIKHLQIPIPLPLRVLTPREKDYSFRIRSSHGLLHTLTAMESIDKIHETYTNYVSDYKSALPEIAHSFAITPEHLLDLIKIAALFDDAARQGDGEDLWDPQSAAACKEFLMKERRLNENLAMFISDTILYKDNADAFIAKYKNKHKNIDFVRQLVNMADTLEVTRTRDSFNPTYMPIAKYVSAKTMVDHIIPELVIPHRQLIIDQGRLSKKGRIDYPGFDDSKYVPGHGIDTAKMAAAYFQKAQQYHLSVLEITPENLHFVINKALRGIKTYSEEHKTSGLQFFHNGFFSPRYHGKLGIERAKYYDSMLSNKDSSDFEKAKVLYALLASKDGCTLQDAVLRSFNQVNRKTVLSQLKSLMKNHLMGEQDSLADINQDIGRYVRKANGVSL